MHHVHTCLSLVFRVIGEIIMFGPRSAYDMFFQRWFLRDFAKEVCLLSAPCNVSVLPSLQVCVSKVVSRVVYDACVHLKSTFSVCLSFCLFVCLADWFLPPCPLPLCLSVSVSVSLSLSLSFCLSVSVSHCLCLCLCLSVSLSL